MNVLKVSSEEKFACSRTGSYPYNNFTSIEMNSAPTKANSQPVITRSKSEQVDDLHNSFELFDDDGDDDLPSVTSTNSTTSTMTSVHKFKKAQSLEHLEKPEIQSFPSMIRIPKEDIEGIGLEVASYELLNPNKKGFLLKRGDIVKKWQRRYFVLKNGKIYYFRDITVCFFFVFFFLFFVSYLYFRIVLVLVLLILNNVKDLLLFLYLNILLVLLFLIMLLVENIFLLLKILMNEMNGLKLLKIQCLIFHYI